MASDNLNQLGKIFNSNRKESDHNIRRRAENFPLVERLRDYIGATRPYRMEFYAYHLNNEGLRVNIKFLESFDKDAIADITVIPITITETGNSVGLDGAVGIQGIWYPLIYLGDLNFEWDAEYSVIFDVSSTGSGTYEHKIVFDGGGVDLTSVTTLESTAITVPISRSHVISPPDTILANAYIYGKVTDLDTAGWLHYAAGSIYQDGILYAPRVIA